MLRHCEGLLLIVLSVMLLISQEHLELHTITCHYLDISHKNDSAIVLLGNACLIWKLKLPLGGRFAPMKESNG